MKVTVVKGKPTDAEAEAVIVALCEEEKRLSGVAAEMDAKSGGLIADIIKSGGFEAKPSQVTMIYSRTLAAKRIALVGLGKK